MSAVRRPSLASARWEAAFRASADSARALGTRNLLKGPLATWAKRYPGIAVEIVEAPGPEVSERLKAERRARRQVADVLSSGDVTSYELQALARSVEAHLKAFFGDG